ncbi:MAG: hypothetical protein MSS28_03845 [Tenericutes bacterium]|nr:hypothetical protein [Mycoplasmatota bacterium]
MKKKVYILLGIIIVNVLIFGGMKSYAAYKAKAEGELAKLNLAKFVFQNQQKQEIGLNISDMIPGDKVSYNFSVTNNKDNVVSDVSIDYKIEVETLQLMPLVVNLYKVVDGGKTLVLTCDYNNKSTSTGKANCVTEVEKLDYRKKSDVSYQIEVLYPDVNSNSEAWGYEYANKYDYLYIKLDSNQSVD